MMGRVDPAELARLTEAVERRFADAGAKAHVETDFAKLRRHVAAVDDPEWIARDQPTFHIDHSELDASNGFWIDVRPLAVAGGAQEGEAGMVGHVAVRLWRDADLHALFASGRILGDRPSDVRLSFRPSPDTARISGAIAFCGGGWVRRDWRSRGLATLLMASAQAKLLELGCDWATAVITAEAAEAGLGVRVWRFRRMHRVAAWKWPHRPEMPMWFCCNGRADMLDAVRDVASANDASEAA